MPTLIVGGLLGGSLVIGGLSGGSAPSPGSGPPLVVGGLLGGRLVLMGLGGSGTTPTPTLASTFLVALTDYLEAHPDILAELGGSGSPRVYVERASTNAVAPYVLVEGVRTSEVDDETDTVDLEVNAYAPTAAAARRLAAEIIKAIDPPGLNPASTRTGRLEWTRGVEEVAMRKPGRGPYRIPGGAFGTRANWARTVPYEFTVHVESDAAQATPDDPYEPATTPATLPIAVAGYLGSSAALTALLGGANKVYTDMTTASGDTRPFVIIEDAEDDPEGESDEEQVVRLSVVAQARTLRAASNVHTLLCDLLDPPGMSRTGRRAVPFEWEGGRELSARRPSSQPQVLDGAGPGGVDVWSWEAQYEFRVEVD